ncbi:MAG: hypothetical protein K5849_06190 [Bacteroidales bacterium]|nr:hypothetical protein [Bacteroidales bacterium]
MKTDRKRFFYSLTLLSALLPVLLSFSFHHHEAHREQDHCEACEQRLPHPGHLGTDETDCLICHFLATFFLPSIPVLPLCCCFVPILEGGLNPLRQITRAQEIRAIRAPPATLCL